MALERAVSQGQVDRASLSSLLNAGSVRGVKEVVRQVNTRLGMNLEFFYLNLES